MRGRTAARTCASRAAGMYIAVTGDLDRRGNTMPGCARKRAPPPDPYTRAAVCEEQLMEDVPYKRAAAALQLEDVQLLERFYNQLVRYWGGGACLHEPCMVCTLCVCSEATVTATQRSCAAPGPLCCVQTCCIQTMRLLDGTLPAKYLTLCTAR